MKGSNKTTSLIESLSNESVDAILAGAKKDGVQIWNDAETASYLDRGVGSKAAFMDDMDGGTLILKGNASEQEIIEEVLHFRQRQSTGSSAEFLKNRTQFEIEAQDMLLEIGQNRG
jgi:hypothetical protein